MGKETNNSFLYTHLMRWEPYTAPGGEGRAWIKTLAKDRSTGARTAIIKYDAGYKQPAVKARWPVDMYVIEGEGEIGERQYRKGTYHYRPAGTAIGPIDSPKGITRLVFTADERARSSGDEVFIQDVNRLKWEVSYVDPTGLKNGVRTLREDRKANITMLIHTAFVPERSLVGQGHIHDHIEEAFVLEGEEEDYLGDVDGHVYWLPGLYVCRKPNQSLHGDSIRHKVPLEIIVRRGWVGNMEEFHRVANNTRLDLPPIDFVE